MRDPGSQALFFPRHFYTIYAIFTRFYAIFTRFYMIFAIFTLLFARHLKLLCRPGSSLDESESELDFFTNEWKVKFDKIPKLTFSPFGENHPYWSKKMYQYGWFSPNGENVNFGILSKLTFHSLMKEKPLGNKVNKCRLCAVHLNIYLKNWTSSSMSKYLPVNLNI